MNLTLLWMMAIPIALAGCTYYAMRNEMPWWGLFVAIIPGALLVSIVFLISHGAAVSDTEVWSGQITSKQRVHGSYQRPYDCNCTTSRDSRGNTTRQCSTCYEDHYTVHWYANSTIGRFTINSRDSTWRSVYNEADPARFVQIQLGDPASDTHSYTNYVQAVPTSIFAAVSTSTVERFKAMLPAYPDQVYDHYRINRFVPVGFNFTDALEWNQDISLMLRELGPKKQVNAIVVVAKTSDPDYQYALQKHWDGVNKNDVVLVIGSEDGHTPAWVSVLSWTKNELFKIQLVDRVKELGVIDRTKIMPILADQIAKNFERRRMREFEYLKAEIDPPTWLIWLTVVLLCGGYGGFIYAAKQQPRSRRTWR